MINLIISAVYYGSNSHIGDLIGGILGIILCLIISAFCSKTDSSKTDGYDSNSYTNMHRSSYDDFIEQTNYDPTWDDPFFEKTGIDPWFDDNPWDHEKK